MHKGVTDSMVDKNDITQETIHQTAQEDPSVSEEIGIESEMEDMGLSS